MDSPLPTVVVIDDSSTVRLFFRRIVADIAVELLTFASAAESMEYLQSARPALLFLDIILPGKDGLTFLTELRRDPHHRDTAVVMISSKDYAQDRMTAKQLGAIDFVAKPMSTQTIRDLILQHTKAQPGQPELMGSQPEA